MYLLLYNETKNKDIAWLTKYALSIAPLCWLHNAPIDNTISIKVDKSILKQLSHYINYASGSFILFVESKIQTDLFRGRSKQLVINKLRLIVDCCQDIDLIHHAKDLLTILGEDKETESLPEKIEKDIELGVDTDAVREYLLRLAKKQSIH
tara:strand:+ start:418 stop:870 length:453 start_codon:yes stop_codon:yes gene_type:complete